MATNTSKVKAVKPPKAVFAEQRTVKKPPTKAEIVEQLQAAQADKDAAYASRDRAFAEKATIAGEKATLLKKVEDLNGLVNLEKRNVEDALNENRHLRQSLEQRTAELRSAESRVLTLQSSVASQNGRISDLEQRNTANEKALIVSQNHHAAAEAALNKIPAWVRRLFGAE